MNRGVRGARIVFLNNFAGPGLGGGEVYLLNVARGCLCAGMDVHVICEPGGRLASEARETGLTVAPYRLNRPNVIRSASRIRKYLGRFGAAIVHSGGVRSDFLAARATGPLKTALVSTVHVEVGASAADGGSGAGVVLRQALQRFAWSRADAIIAVSGAVARSVESLGVSAERVVVVHNGIEIGAVRAIGEAGPDPALGLPTGRPIVGCVARLEPVKGVEDFLRAAAIVAEARPDAAFVVVGGGSQEASLRGLAFDLGIAERVTFTGSVVPSAGVMSSFAVTVVPSLSEGMGIAAVESMALRIPVVATRVGGLPEVVDDGRTGLLVPPRDPGAAADAIVRLLDDPETRRSMGSAGLSRAVDEFAVDVMVKRHLRVYRELLQRRTR